MCVAVPGKVVSIEDGMGKVDFFGAYRDVALDFLADVKVGDYVIVHAGYAVEKIKEDEALKTIELFEELKEFGDV